MKLLKLLMTSLLLLFSLSSLGFAQVSESTMESQISCLEALEVFDPEQETILHQDGFYFFTTWNEPGAVDKEDYDNNLRVLVIYDSNTMTSFYVELRRPQKKKFGYSIYQGAFLHPMTGQYFEYEVSYSFILDGPGWIEKVDFYSSDQFKSLSPTGESEVLSIRFLEKLNWIMRGVRHETRQPDATYSREDLQASEIPNNCQGIGYKKFRFL